MNEWNYTLMDRQEDLTESCGTLSVILGDYIISGESMVR